MDELFQVIKYDDEDTEDLEKINQDNVWSNALRKFLETGVLEGGAPAIKHFKPAPKVRHVSTAQRRAIGIEERN